MSFIYDTFEDGTGRDIIAVNARKFDNVQAREIAKKELNTDNIDYCTEYRFAHFGFCEGRNDMSTWWITPESKNITSVPVYCFVRRGD